MRIRSLCVPVLLLLSTSACGDDAAGGSDTSADTAVGDTTSGDTSTGDATATTDAPETTTAPDGEVEDDVAPADTEVGDAPTETADTVDPAYGFAVVEVGVPVDITPDGTTIAFWNAASANGDTWFYDVGAGSLTLETTVGPTFRDFPTALASDLTLTALHGEPVQAGVWNGTTWRKLGSLFEDGCGLDPGDATLGEIGAAWDVSADGKIVVGSLWDGCTTVAFRWSELGETRDFRALAVLGAAPEGASLAPVNRATVVSDDGLVAAGFAQTALVDRWPAVWSTEDTTGYLLTTDVFTSDSPGEIMAIETDGSIAGGIWNNEAFIVTLDGTPTVTKLDPLPNVLPGETSRVNVLAANGTLAFGSSGGPFLGIQQAFVWSAAKGTRNLKEVATAQGITIAEDVILTNVLAASTDGSVVVGTFTDDSFVERSFVLRMPAAAYAE